MGTGWCEHCGGTVRRKHERFCSKSCATSHRTPRARDRILARLILQPNGCMYWAGIIDQDGYGRIGYKGMRGVPLQRAVYDCFVGPIPENMTVDHQCHNSDLECLGGKSCLHRRCGNWEHYTLKTGIDNTLSGKGITAQNKRKKQCVNDHRFDDSNTYMTAGRRRCIECYTIVNGHPPVRKLAMVNES